MSIPKDTRWGVDSLNRITPAALQAIEKKMKIAPDFWGRYLVQGKLDDAEIDFLRRVGHIRLLLLYNPANINSTVRDPPDPKAEYMAGLTEAAKAKAAADGIKLKIPDGVWIYANVEPKRGAISADWIRGWWEGMRATRFEFGGIYGNVSRDQKGVPGPKKTVGFIGDAYKQALAKMPSGFDPPLYSEFPHNGLGIPKQYSPEEPPGVHGAVKIWQYFAEGSSKIGFDANLATKRAFEHMWKLPAVAAAPSHEEHERVETIFSEG